MEVPLLPAGAILLTIEGNIASNKLNAQKKTKRPTHRLKRVECHKESIPNDNASMAMANKKTWRIFRLLSAMIINGTIAINEPTSTGRYTCQWFWCCMPMVLSRSNGTTTKQAVINRCSKNTPTLSRNNSGLLATSQNCPPLRTRFILGAFWNISRAVILPIVRTIFVEP